MNSREVISVFILSLFFLCIIPIEHPALSNQAQFVLSEDTLIHSTTHFVPSQNHSSFSTTIGQGNGIYGHFQVTQGYAVELVVLSSTDFESLQAGHLYNEQVRVEEDLSGAFTFIVPFTDEWYFVLLNDNYGDSWTALSLSHDGTPPELSINFQNRTSFGVTYSFSLTMEDDYFPVNYRLYVDGSQHTTYVTTGSSMTETITLDAHSFTVGWHSLFFVYSDGVGNSLSSPRYHFYVQEPPVTFSGPIILTPEALLLVGFPILLLGVLVALLRGRNFGIGGPVEEHMETLTLVRQVLKGVGEEFALWEHTLSEKVQEASQERMDPRATRKSLKVLVEKGFLKYADDGISLYLPKED